MFFSFLGHKTLVQAAMCEDAKTKRMRGEIGRQSKGRKDRVDALFFSREDVFINVVLFVIQHANCFSI